MSTQPSTTRTLPQADPLEDFDRDYADWELNLVPMGERRNLLIDRCVKAVWVDRDLYVEFPEFTTVSIRTRIENPDLPGGPEKDWFADAVAAIILDRPESRPLR